MGKKKRKKLRVAASKLGSIGGGMGNLNVGTGIGNNAVGNVVVGDSQNCNNNYVSQQGDCHSQNHCETEGWKFSL
jgi:hypothetical protein